MMLIDTEIKPNNSSLWKIILKNSRGEGELAYNFDLLTSAAYLYNAYVNNMGYSKEEL